MKTRHNGDCTIYAALANIGMPEAGICTCGYGHEKNRHDGHGDELYSKELLEKLEKEANSKVDKNVFITNEDM